MSDKTSPQFGFSRERFALLGDPDARVLAAADVAVAAAVRGLARLGYGAAGDLAFCDRAPTPEMTPADGAVILCTGELKDELVTRWPGCSIIACEDPRAVFIDLGEQAMRERLVDVSSVLPRPFGIHPSVRIGDGARIHPESRIDEGVVIGAGCTIGRGTWLQAGVVVREHAVIGTEGINAYRGRDGKVRRFPHLAGTVIGAGTEIGAAAVIVRGIVNSTRIGRNCVIGNLCNVGHAAELGDGVWMSVGCLVGGHARIREGVTIGMGAQIRDNIEVAERAQVGMGSVVVRDVAASRSVFGVPAKVVPAIAAGPAR